MTSSHAKKNKNQNKNNKTQRGCEMNHYKVNTEDHLRFPAIKKWCNG
jgi:hypothetical protein